MARQDTAQQAQSITPSDSGSLSDTFGIYVGTGGDLRVDMQEGGTVTFSSVPTGAFLPIQVKRIYATGTTAGNILALY